MVRSNWKVTTLDTAAAINPREAALSETAPFIPMDAVHVGKRYAQYFEPRGKRSGARAASGDVLFARITPCLENGKVAQVPSAITQCGGSTEFIVIRGSAIAIPDFLYFWATWDDTRVQAARLMTGTTGRQRLSADDLGGLALLLPPIPTQKRIVDVLTSVDAYIAALQQQADDARTARNAVLHALLTVGGDDWTETTLGEAASINPREAALNQNAPFIPMDAVHVGKRFAQYLEPRGERSGARAKGGDILFARITPCLENGKVAQVPPNIERCGGSTEFIVIRGSALTSPDFLYFWATWSDTRVRAAGLMTGTTGRQRLSAGDLGALPLLLPPFSEQNRIVETVSAMDELVYSTEQAIAEAQKLRSGLLSSLLSGEHEIPETYDRLLGAA
jgi:hypothetical protein